MCQSIEMIQFISKHPLIEKTLYVLYAIAIHFRAGIANKLSFYFGYWPKYIIDRGYDKWVINEVFDSNYVGYFLEIGAMDGITFSNTYMLEKKYNWEGICVEPNHHYYRDLTKNRECICVPDCIDINNNCVEYILANELSGIVDYDTDNNYSQRENFISDKKNINKVISLNTISLEYLLEKNNAPKIIDYFSLDVEGAEERILTDFPFQNYVFLSLTIERPTPYVNELLFNNGYIFVKNYLFDSFYVHNSINSLHRIKKKPFKQLPFKSF